MLLAIAAVTALVGVGAGPSGPVAEAAPQSGTLTSSSPVTVVASGLNSPRSLTWGPRGRLLVAETGSPPVTAPSVCNFYSEEITLDMKCFGKTGSISDVSSGTPKRIVKGLPSALNLQDMIGPNSVSYVDGKLYVLQAGAPQAVPSWLPKDLKRTLKKQLGALLDVTDGSPSVVANAGQADYQWVQDNPDASPNDLDTANPYALTPKPGGGFYYVDAASNTLGSIDVRGKRGKARVLTSFPVTSGGKDSVPTCLDMGPDGAVYVGELTGHGSSATEADVYRYEPWSGRLAVWEKGFSAITGCGFGANGDFYVTELDTTGFLPTGDPEGVVIQIGKDRTRTVLGAGKLFAPHGFLAGPDGSIYVANESIWWPPGTTGRWDEGEVVKIG
ncbi:ScyD/ScyE family protein [Streptomyces sp. NPDC052236]|uniref:ScyD/ScyE family protein n=1 Tax=Streptomyces sp. NPDC052236 TaxID=3365686 RepID=UPI0037D1412F